MLTAEFRESGRLGGSAGCNRYMASYEASRTALTVSPQIASTQMWCEHPEGTMAQESAFLGSWSRVVAFALSEDRLELKDRDGSTVLEFVSAGPADGGREESAPS